MSDLIFYHIDDFLNSLNPALITSVLGLKSDGMLLVGADCIAISNGHSKEISLSDLHFANEYIRTSSWNIFFSTEEDDVVADYLVAYQESKNAD